MQFNGFENGFSLLLANGNKFFALFGHFFTLFQIVICFQRDPQLHKEKPSNAQSLLEFPFTENNSIQWHLMLFTALKLVLKNYHCFFVCGDENDARIEHQIYRKLNEFDRNKYGFFCGIKLLDDTGWTFIFPLHTFQFSQMNERQSHSRNDAGASQEIEKYKKYIIAMLSIELLKP